MYDSTYLMCLHFKNKQAPLKPQTSNIDKNKISKRKTCEFHLVSILSPTSKSRSWLGLRSRSMSKSRSRQNYTLQFGYEDVFIYEQTTNSLVDTEKNLVKSSD